MPVWLLGATILFLLLIWAALVAFETAFFSMSANEADKLSSQPASGRFTFRLLKMREQSLRLLAGMRFSQVLIQVATITLFGIFVTTLMPVASIESWIISRNAQLTDSALILSNVLVLAATILGATFLAILFGEIGPKVFAWRYPQGVIKRLSGISLVILDTVGPVGFFLSKWTFFVERKKAALTPQFGRLTSREEIDEAIELTVSKEEDAGQEIDILKSVVKFGDVVARQIMRARIDVVAADFRISYHELLKVVRESGYSRIPIYDEDFDSITGILYVKDLLGHLQESDQFEWQQLIRTNMLFVPETKKISDLLKEFQRRHLHMAIVVDEYGGTSGIVTLEDIMEEVIGDIKDEFDDEPEVIFQKIDDNTYIFEGKTLLNDVCRVMGIDTDSFDDFRGDADSFAGLILELLADMPKEGEELIRESFRFKVVSVNERRIEQIMITLNPQNNNSEV